MPAPGVIRASQSCDIPVTTLPSATVRMNQTTRRFGYCSSSTGGTLIIRDGLKLVGDNK